MSAIEIIKAKQARRDSYLWVHSSGDCILWPSEAESQGDNGSKAIGRWSLSPADLGALIDSGEVDEIA